MSMKNWIRQEKLRDKPIQELRELVAENKSNMFKKRLQRVSGRLENYREFPEARRRLAVLLTLIREKELAEQASSKKS